MSHTCLRAIALATSILFAGCGGTQDFLESKRVASQPAAIEATLQSVAPVIPADARLVIRTATMDLVVEDASESLSRAIEAVKSRGGYVAETRQWSESNRLRASATLRVPANMLEAAIADIRKEATRVNHEGITGQDVSEEFFDLGAQLTNLRSTETELRQLLTTVRERTQKASDVLEVYQELSKVRGNIERLQGRVEYLKQMTAMSTINLTFTPDELSEPIIEPGWNPIAIAKTAVRALFATLKLFGTASIWVVVFLLPLFAVILGLALLFRKLGKSFLRSR